jgi:class 3 adenylate cyclase/tetratricopeptide (TPR) repeat protein
MVMRCPECSYENLEGARFCGQCASTLTGAVECPSCGFVNPVAQKFCNACASSLIEPGRAPEPARDGVTPDAPAPPEHLAQKIRAARGSLEGEHKQVTVLFADVMGSMDLAGSVDAERWQRIMDRFFALLCEGVHRFEGTVNKFTGDGIMALFGAPIAHEDHARRACYAALSLADGLAAYAAELRREEGLNFLVRMGLNSGEVVVGTIGDDLRLDYTAIGHTVGLAQRMEALAEPGRAYLTQHTAQLVSGYFQLEDLGPFELKGVREPVYAFALAGVGAMRTRLDVSAARGFSRFVGRRDELATLEAALAGALERNGQVVGVVGEPGLGKSRLCYELAERARAQGIAVYEGHGVAHGKRIPMLPILELLRHSIGLTEQDSDQGAREKIAGRLLLLDEGFKDDLPLIFDFLGVPDPERPAPRIDPEARQRQLFAVGKRLIQTRSRREPAIYLLEDLHWFDDASEAFLANSVEAVGGTRTLLLANFRPEFHAAWMQKSYYQQLPLLPLGSEAIDELLEDLLGTDPSLEELAARIRERTGGNPFFIEEVVQALLESGDLAGERGVYQLVGRVDEIALPPTVQAVLAARIDRLEERDKQVLQAAAVIGRDFAEPVLRLVSNVPEGELPAAIAALTAAEFIYEQTLYPEAEHTFKHPLTQEVAYASQLSERRAQAHAAVARAVVKLYPDKLDERAALVAHHFEQAGDPLEAARWSRRAAEWAGPVHPADAMRHWRKVSELVRGLPESSETIELGVTACVHILQFAWRVGISEEEARQVFETGKELADRTGDIRVAARLVSAYSTAVGNIGNLEESLRQLDEAGKMADRIEDPELRVGLKMRSYWDWLAGDLQLALKHAEALIESSRDDVMLGRSLLGFSPHIWNVMFRGAILLPLMGRIDEGIAELERALRLAREHEEVEITGWARGSYSWIAWLTLDGETGVRRAREGLEAAERIGSSFSRVIAYTALARSAVAVADWEQAAMAASAALKIARDTGAGLTTEGAVLSLLAEAQIGRGELDLARCTAEEAVVAARRRRTRSAELFSHLALAQALLRADGAASASAIAASLTRALALVEETGAAALEPFVRVELAELARLSDDREGRTRELHEAERLFAVIGAPRRATELANRLAAPSAQP